MGHRGELHPATSAVAPSDRTHRRPEPKAPMSRRRDRRPLILLAVLLLLLVVMVAGIMIGSVSVSIGDIWAALAGEHTGGGRFIVWNLRLPREQLAALVGKHLAVAGAILQSDPRNPLADPQLLGLSGGGALLAVLALRVAPGAAIGSLPPLAFAGSLAGALIVYLLAWRGGVSPSRLILAGVAVGALFAAFTTGILLTSSLTVQAIMSWLAGGFYARSWPHVETILPYSLIGIAGAMLLARRLDVLALGDEPAAVLGVRVQRLRALLTGLAAVLTGSAVAVAGLIGFVGLIVPHAARMLVGSGHRYAIPVGALLGGALLVGSDLIARTIVEPRELPVGVVTAAIGAPAFLYLLRRRT
ncbi:MAG: FecCD family ABC transporter permease [Dehalococcoidia bacterium]